MSKPILSPEDMQNDNPDRLVVLQTYVRPDQLIALNQLAKRERRSRGVYMRDIIDRFLTETANQSAA